MCSEGWTSPDVEVDGECSTCGVPTVCGVAQHGCHWSPVLCKECGDAPCDDSC